jgi:predicted SnoaL-like aldol condensation-catalyzing enzyme
MSKDNVAMAREVIEEIFNKGNMAAVDEYAAETMIGHNPLPGITPDRGGLKQRIGMIRTAFPDVHYTIEDVIASDDTVVLRVVCRGTQTGELGGRPATGKQATWTETHILRLDNGKPVEHWRNGDDLGMLQQLGMLGPPGGHR